MGEGLSPNGVELISRNVKMAEFGGLLKGVHVEFHNGIQSQIQMLEFVTRTEQKSVHKFEIIMSETQSQKRVFLLCQQL